MASDFYLGEIVTALNRIAAATEAQNAHLEQIAGALDDIDMTLNARDGTDDLVEALKKIADTIADVGESVI